MWSRKRMHPWETEGCCCWPLFFFCAVGFWRGDKRTTRARVSVANAKHEREQSGWYVAANPTMPSLAESRKPSKSEGEMMFSWTSSTMIGSWVAIYIFCLTEEILWVMTHERKRWREKAHGNRAIIGRLWTWFTGQLFIAGYERLWHRMGTFCTARNERGREGLCKNKE